MEGIQRTNGVVSPLSAHLMSKPSPSIPLTESHQDRRYVAVTILISIGLVAFKTLLAWNLHASAMFSDDYAYLNKSIYYIHGQWDMPGYIFQNVFAGILYPLAIAPWMLFDSPETRIFTVFLINSIMSAVAVLFGSLAVRNATDRPVWPAPICIAVFTPMFLFSFVAMTENLVFPLLAVTAWLCTDFDRTLQSRARFAGLCAMIAALPLVRAPGLAAGAAVFVMCAISCWRIGWLKAGGRAILALVATLVPYLIVMRFAPTIHSQANIKREARYLGTIATIIEDPWCWWLTLRITLTQLKYVLLVTGGFCFPAFIASYLIRRPEGGPRPRPRIGHLRSFTLLAGLAMLAIIELHIIRKIQFNIKDVDFIFGRYADPIAFLILIAGLAALPLLQRARLKSAGVFVVRILAPVAIAVSIARVWNDSQIASFNQTGLAGFCGSPKYPIHYAMAAVAVVAIVFQLPLRRKWFARSLVLMFIAWSVFSSTRGMNVYVYPRAELIARSQQAGSWLAANSPPDTRVGFDRKVFRSDSPTWRTMGLHYQAMVFAMYPREFGFIGDDDTMRKFDYLFTCNTRAPTPDLPVAWTNGDYVLYRIVDDVAVYDPNEIMPLSEPASPDIIIAERMAPDDNAKRSVVMLDFADLHQSCCPGQIPFADCAGVPPKILNTPRRLTMAWKNSTVFTPYCALSTGAYALQIRAKADGCPDDMAILRIHAKEIVDQELAIAPDRVKCYTVPFSLAGPQQVTFTLTFTNNGMCGAEGNRIDKNIYIEALSIVAVEDDTPAIPIQP